MPAEPADMDDIRERATKIKVRNGSEVFVRGVREILFDGVPEKEVDVSVKDVPVVVTYDDGTQDTFYILMSARRPLTVPEA